MESVNAKSFEFCITVTQSFSDLSIRPKSYTAKKTASVGQFHFGLGVTQIVGLTQDRAMIFQIPQKKKID
jgi:hypothetical protein